MIFLKNLIIKTNAMENSNTIFANIAQLQCMLYSWWSFFTSLYKKGKGRPNRLRFRLIDGRFKKSENLQQASLSGRCTPARGNTERFNRGITCVQTRKQSRWSQQQAPFMFKTLQKAPTAEWWAEGHCVLRGCGKSLDGPPCSGPLAIRCSMISPPTILLTGY